MSAAGRAGAFAAGRRRAGRLPPMSASPVLVVPAAGAGSRLGASVPKLLVPVNGRAMIDHLLDLYAPWVGAVILVLNPSAEPAVRDHLRARPERILFREQARPTGMLDAVLVPEADVRTLSPSRVWVTWCDQIAVHPATVRALADAGAADAPLILPVARRRDPYVHLARDEAGRIVAVLHRREGDPMPAVGETEIGLFSLSRRAYLEDLPIFAAGVQPGSGTRERNFLPFIPWVAARGGVVTFPCVEEMESVGVNTADDLAQVAAYLAARGE